ncbi:hypothetical protein ACP4OV_012570 [Aristida adscensionis]
MTTAAMEDSSKQLLQAHIELWHQSLCYVKSLALAVAMDLRIADAIRHHGGAATLAEILAKTALHPCKLRALRRLMRVLTVSGTFAVEQRGTPPAGAGEAVYKLTAASRFLVGDETSLAPFLMLALRPVSVSPHAAAICAWFRQDRPAGPSVFSLVYRKDQTVWEQAGDANELLNNGMAADSRFLVPIVLKECGGVFHGIDSLVDVGGGHGRAAAAIAEAIPGLKCSVLDLPHVVAGAPSDCNLQFIAGDMFQSIPPANAVFLKQIGDQKQLQQISNGQHLDKAQLELSMSNEAEATSLIFPQGYFTDDDVMAVGPVSYTKMMKTILAGSTSQVSEYQYDNSWGNPTKDSTEIHYKNSMVVTTNRLEITQGRDDYEQSQEIQDKSAEEAAATATKIIENAWDFNLFEQLENDAADSTKAIYGNEPIVEDNRLNKIQQTVQSLSTAKTRRKTMIWKH